MEGKVLVKLLALCISSCWGIDNWSFNSTGAPMEAGNDTLVIAGYPSMECEPDKEAIHGFTHADRVWYICAIDHSVENVHTVKYTECITELR